MLIVGMKDDMRWCTSCVSLLLGLRTSINNVAGRMILGTNYYPRSLVVVLFVSGLVVLGFQPVGGTAR